MKKLMLMMMFTLLLVGTVSAADFAFDNYKEVSPDKTLIVYKDKAIFGEDTTLAEFELKTPHANAVGIGYQKVFEYEIRNTYEDVDKMIGNLEFYNIKDGMKSTNVNIDFKYKYNETYTEKECNSVNNKSVCEDVEKTREVWKDYTSKTMVKGDEIIISGWTTTKEGDHIEWEQYFYDDKLFIDKSIWASWAADLNTGLALYYALNESTGTNMLDSVQGVDGETHNMDNSDWVAGLIGNSLNFDGSNDYANVSQDDESVLTNTLDSRDYSISLWVNPDTLLSGMDYKSFLWGGTGAKELRVYYYDSAVRFAVLDTTWNALSATADLGGGTWYHIVATYDHSSTNSSLYLDGVLKDYDNTMHTHNPTSTAYYSLAAKIGGATQNYYGEIDEVGFWNRTLSSTEVTQLNNGGSGITYDKSPAGDPVPSVFLESPGDNLVSTDSFIYFNSTVTDNYEVHNVSLYINGSINETNSSNFNGTYIFNETLSEGTWNWSIVAYDNNTGINESATRTLIIDTTPQINVTSPSPTNNTNYTTSTIFFNATYSPAVDYWIVDYNGSNVTLPAINTTLDVEDGLSFNLKLYANNSESGVFGLNESIYFSVDTSDPDVNVTYPYNSPLIDYHRINTTMQLNWTATDQNLGYCWVELFNGTNQTQTCNVNTTDVNITNYNNTNLTFWVNDTVGNYVGYPVNWTWQIFETGRSFSEPAYETNNETFVVNVTANSSLTAMNLYYNGSLYTMSNSAGSYSTTFDIPSVALGFQDFYFSGTYGGATINTSSDTQTVNETNWFNCNTTWVYPLLNLTFYDEATLSQINATIPTSTWEYYMGSGDVNKSYTFVEATNLNYNYTFCGEPNESIFVVPYVQYSSTGYPQRVWNPTALSYNTTDMYTKPLYLLGSADGIYVTFQVLSTTDNPISGVDVTAERTISGSTVNVGAGTTGADGGVTFWLNPNFQHTFSFVKTGYDTYTTSFAPTQSAYTIVLGGTSTTSFSDYTREITMKTNPPAGTLSNWTNYNFNFTLSSSYWTVDEYGFRLKLDNGTVINTTSGTTNGGFLSIVSNVRDYDRVYMDYYYVVNGTTMGYTTSWNVFNSNYTQWSIDTFFDDLDSYFEAGMFGFDDFAFSFIIFMTMFLGIGILGFKYGRTQPLLLSAMIFAIVFFFDVVVDLLPEMVGAVPNILTYAAGLILIITIYKEFQQ